MGDPENTARLYANTTRLERENAELRAALKKIWEINKSYRVDPKTGESTQIDWSVEESVQAMEHLWMAADAEARAGDEARAKNAKLQEKFNRINEKLHDADWKTAELEAEVKELRGALQRAALLIVIRERGLLEETDESGSS
jgi:hypothetical protein